MFIRERVQNLLEEHFPRVLGPLILSYLEEKGVYTHMLGKYGQEEIKRLHNITSLPSGELIVVDAGDHCIRVFGSEGKFLRMWGAEQGRSGNKAGEFTFPRGITALSDPTSEIFVADTLNHRIQVFTPEGQFLRMWGREGRERGMLSAPYNVTGLYRPLSDKGRKSPGSSGEEWKSPSSPEGKHEIFVTELYNHRIQVFTPQGQFLRMWGKYGSEPGNFRLPHSIAALYTPGSSSEIFVADMRNHRIQVFTPEGQFLREWGREGANYGEFNLPSGIAVLPSGEVVVADTHNHRIQVFTPAGKFLYTWGKEGREEGEFRYPIGISAFSDEVAIVDSDNARIQFFRILLD